MPSEHKQSVGAAEYSDASPFVRLLKTPGSVKMLDAFLRESHHDLRSKELQKLTGIDQSTVSRNIETLLDYDLVKETRTGKKGQRYQVDLDNSAAEAFAQAQDSLFNSAHRTSDKTGLNTVGEYQPPDSSSKDVADKVRNSDVGDAIEAADV